MGSLFKRDGKWGIDYYDARGSRVRKMIAKDKSVALAALGAAVTTVERIKAGILTADPNESKRPIGEHLRDFIADLRRRGRDDMYIYSIQKRVEIAIRKQRWRSLRDCTPKSISAFLSGLATTGLTGRTINAYRAELHAFFNWCVRHDLLEANPCARVAKIAVKPDKKRRALSVAECRALIEAAPPERRLAYLFLVYTGLRRAEAEEVRWCDVLLDVANPHIVLPASTTKSGRGETVPLVPQLAEALRAHRGEAEDGDYVFDRIPTMEAFRGDLTAAGIEHEDPRGRKVVLHSLRHSLATMLAQSQVPPAIAMKIMRHRDIRLTLELYTDEALLPASAAIATLPSLAPEPARAKPGVAAG